MRRGLLATVAAIITAGGGGGAVTPPLEVNLAPWDIETDFADQPNGAFAVPGWTLYGDTARWAITDGGLHRGPDWPDAAGFAMCDTAVGAEFRAEFTYDTAGVDVTSSDVYPYNTANTFPVFWWVDATHYFGWKLDKANSRLELFRQNGGGGATHITYFPVPGGFLDIGKIRYEARGDFLRVWHNDLLLLPDAGATGSYTAPWDKRSIADVDGGDRGGKLGFMLNIYRYKAFYGLRATALYVAVDHLSRGYAIGPIDSPGADAVALTGAYAGKTPVTGIARILSYPSRDPVVDWAETIGFDPDAGAFSAALARIPTGGPYLIQRGYIDDEGLAYVDECVPAYAGALIVPYGQSNSDALRTNYSTDAGRPANVLSWSYSEEQWVTPENQLYTHHRACGDLAKTLAPLVDIPILCAAVGEPGSGIYELVPGGSNYHLLEELCDQVGNPAAFLLGQGENDADGAAWAGDWGDVIVDDLMPGLRILSGNPNVKLGLLITGNYLSPDMGGHIPSSADGIRLDGQRNSLKLTIRQLVEDNAFLFLSSSRQGCGHGEDGDTGVTDPYHYGGRDNNLTPQVGYTQFSKRDGYSVARHVFGLDVADGAGSKGVALIRTGATIRLTFDHHADVTGMSRVDYSCAVDDDDYPAQPAGRLDGFDIFLDADSSRLTINSIAIDDDELVFTLSADPGGPVRMVSMRGWSYNDRYLYRCTYADGRDAIPIDEINVPLVSN